MAACASCTCASPRSAACSSRLLVATSVAHTATALQSALTGAGVAVEQRVPGLMAVHATDPSEVLRLLRTSLSSVEADEVRVADIGEVSDEALLAAVMSAPTLATADARSEHADLLALFGDETGSFRSVYQPIVDLRSGTVPVVGYEALLRATGPGGPIMPAALFQAATEAGWLHALDRVGRTTALRGAAGWLEDRLLFVNFLPTTIYRPEVCLRTTELAARQAGLRLDQLVFEVTESERITDIGHLEAVFAYYRERGCRVALDDLGAGYSSLNILVRLLPDVVKLDRDIVQRLPDPASVAVVRAVVEITHGYGGQVLAECVETAEQAAAAAELGVDLGQGWHFGRPEERTRTVASPLRAAPPPTPRAARWDDPAVALPAPALAPVTEEPPGAGVPDPPAAPSAAGAAGAPGAAAAAALEAPAPGLGELLTRALDVCSDGVTIADARRLDTPLIYVNRAFSAMTGWPVEEVVGRNCRFLQAPGNDPAALTALRVAVREGREHVTVLRNRRKDGSEWWNELHISPITDAAGQVSHIFGFQHDVTDRVEAQRRAEFLADHDALTGLPNRRRLLDALDEAVREEAPGRRTAVLFVDLDGFKAVNDRLGHAGGDLALTAAAACLRGALRDGDLLARYSGDEFVALLRDVPPDAVMAVARRAADALVASLVPALEVAGAPIQLGASVGVALHPQHGRSADELLRAADVATYAAKAAGRGRVVVAGAASPGLAVSSN